MGEQKTVDYEKMWASLKKVVGEQIVVEEGKPFAKAARYQYYDEGFVHGVKRVLLYINELEKDPNIKFVWKAESVENTKSE